MGKDYSNWLDLDFRTKMAVFGSEEYNYFVPLVVADYLDFSERVNILGLNDTNLETSLRTLSIQGHLVNGNIKNAINYLFDNIQHLRKKFNVILPPDVHNGSDYLDSMKSTFVNTIQHDILSVLHNKKLIKKSPRQVMNTNQQHIDEYELFLLDIANGNYRPFTQRNGQPLFGMQGNINREFNSENEALAFLVSSMWGLGVMDSDYWRVESGIEGICCGLSVPLNRNNLVKQSDEYLFMHDLKTITQIDVKEELDLNPDMSKEEARQMFYQVYMPLLYEAEIAYRGQKEQNNDITSGYVRIFNGEGNPGTADFMSNIYAGLMFGEIGFWAIHMADFEDTIEKVALKSTEGGQDAVIVDKLLSIPRVRKLFDQYIEQAINLIHWSYENPEASFNNIESCSIRYLLMEYKNVSGRSFNTLGQQDYFLKHFQPQYKLGSVDRGINSFPIGFGRASSRAYFDYVLKQSRDFLQHDLFPDWSWIAHSNKGKEFEIYNIQ